MENKQFPEGISFRNPRDKSPNFIKGHLSIKCKEFTDYLRKVATPNDKGEYWVNLDIKESKGGKIYLDINTWKPEKKQEHPFGQGKTYNEAILHKDEWSEPTPENEVDLSKIPF